MQCNAGILPIESTTLKEILNRLETMEVDDTTSRGTKRKAEESSIASQAPKRIKVDGLKDEH